MSEHQEQNINNVEEVFEGQEQILDSQEQAPDNLNNQDQVLDNLVIINEGSKGIPNEAQENVNREDIQEGREIASVENVDESDSTYYITTTERTKSKAEKAKEHSRKHMNEITQPELVEIADFLEYSRNLELFAEVKAPVKISEDKKIINTYYSIVYAKTKLETKCLIRMYESISRKEKFQLTESEVRELERLNTPPAKTILDFHNNSSIQPDNHNENTLKFVMSSIKGCLPIIESYGRVRANKFTKTSSEKTNKKIFSMYLTGVTSEYISKLGDVMKSAIGNRYGNPTVPFFNTSTNKPIGIFDIYFFPNDGDKKSPKDDVSVQQKLHPQVKVLRHTGNNVNGRDEYIQVKYEDFLDYDGPVILKYKLDKAYSGNNICKLYARVYEICLVPDDSHKPNRDYELVSGREEIRVSIDTRGKTKEYAEKVAKVFKDIEASLNNKSETFLVDLIRALEKAGVESQEEIEHKKRNLYTDTTFNFRDAALDIHKKIYGGQGLMQPQQPSFFQPQQPTYSPIQPQQGSLQNLYQPQGQQPTYTPIQTPQNFYQPQGQPSFGGSFMGNVASSFGGSPLGSTQPNFGVNTNTSYTGTGTSTGYQVYNPWSQGTR